MKCDACGIATDDYYSQPVMFKVIWKGEEKLLCPKCARLEMDLMEDK